MSEGKPQQMLNRNREERLVAKNETGKARWRFKVVQDPMKKVQGLYFETQAQAERKCAALREGKDPYHLQYLLDWHTGHGIFLRDNLPDGYPWGVVLLTEPEENEFGIITP